MKLTLSLMIASVLVSTFAWAADQSPAKAWVQGGIFDGSIRLAADDEDRRRSNRDDDDDRDENVGADHHGWTKVGCESSERQCHDHAHQDGYTHSRLVEDHHACHHEPHLLCLAQTR